MHIAQVLKQHQPAISFEFFPPKTEAASQELFQTISQLVPLKPAYVSVTYGAGGSTRTLTHDLVVKLREETNLTIVSHLTCVGSGQEEIRQILQTYQDRGIKNIMALRGDPPQTTHIDLAPHQDFHHAVELVRFIKKHFPSMGVGVAGFPEGHPDTPNRLKEIDYLKNKIDAGADYICTQLFFDNRDFYDFRERCELAHINVPIIAGIMPITSKKGMTRMSELALGARFPAKLLRAMNETALPGEAEQIGIHWATEQVLDLLDHEVQGIHFYTLNKSKASLQIYDALGIQNFDMLRK
ncbi:methylenetetrahydrofolate reductase [NAD(P)H] [Candidatus Nitronereus thalassa]|uniref:Methylenetetrahydrofolate reductase n=1 Tax=Candidatus Nitronereus thalassa TaxID=3020898 RepID=A0ABU3K6X3_9BACT|nr:methylenetetrahydrofolate reductase [NAD(P)H] [Candidatus Nitronereus thalassa]MDT7042190.1 methylenetetrahydrofolate reductase [NAD(P)H] [Candidatus Nitronereus thalassa]